MYIIEKINRNPYSVAEFHFSDTAEQQRKRDILKLSREQRQLIQRIAIS